ncbi:MAG: hypothetical protein WD229_04945 [Pirellulales bacterium]
MGQELQATYEQGVLRLDKPLALPEQARVTGEVRKVETLPTAEPLSLDEFDRLLDELAMPLGGKRPANISREDIYSGHD